MRKCWMLALVIAVALTAMAQKKPKTMPMPPTVSHGLPISNYACAYSPTSQVSTTEYWNVTGFAEYGPNHKRYWTKSLGTFVGSESASTYDAESIQDGDASSSADRVTSTGKYGAAAQKCSEWKEAVHEFLVKSLRGPSNK